MLLLLLLAILDTIKKIQSLEINQASIGVFLDLPFSGLIMILKMVLMRALKFLTIEELLGEGMEHTKNLIRMGLLSLELQ